MNGLSEYLAKEKNGLNFEKNEHVRKTLILRNEH